MIRWIMLCLIGVLAPCATAAHDLQPGYLDLRALGEDRWSVVWRKPDMRGTPMPLDAVLSAPCDAPRGPAPTFDGAGWSARWLAACPGGLGGVTITIAGLEATRTDVLVRYELVAGQGQTWRLVPSAPSFAVPETPDAVQVLTSYVCLGVEHILFGPDHLVFVLALMLLIRGLRPLIAAITAFTVAHSVTLGAAALGWLMIPGPPVEAVIACLLYTSPSPRD